MTVDANMFIDERERRLRQLYYVTRVFMFICFAFAILVHYMPNGLDSSFRWFLSVINAANGLWHLWWSERLLRRIVQLNVASVPSAHVIRVLQGGKASCQQEPSRSRSASTRV